jgi:hypothetical protein
MKSRDAEFFHDDLIMSNSIRTMLNLADDPEDMELKSRKEMSPENDQRDPNDQRKLVIEEPVVMYVYDLNDQTYGGIVEEI